MQLYTRVGPGRGWSLVVVLALVGCSSGAARGPGGSAVRADAGGSRTASTVPLSPQGTVPSVAGTVEETMNATSYTYVRIRTSSGDVWVAGTQFPVAVGDRVVAVLETPMRDFHSRSLKRDFPLIYFSSQVGREGVPPGSNALAGGGETVPMAVDHGGAAAPTTPANPVVVQPASPPPGGVSIAELWARRADLAGKTVTVRGTVVKVNAGILDRNWFHLQDGSGKPQDGTHDLTVTTRAEVTLGDRVTVTGRVAVDRDFGAGYVYKVMIEGASLAAAGK